MGIFTLDLLTADELTVEISTISELKFVCEYKTTSLLLKTHKDSFGYCQMCYTLS